MTINLLMLPVRLIAFGIWFAGQMLQSSWIVLVDIVTPGLTYRPRVVRLSLESRRDFHVATMGALITLTPGTLTLGVVPEPDGTRALLVHSMTHPDNPSALTSLHDLERRMLDALHIGATR